MNGIGKRHVFAVILLVLPSFLLLTGLGNLSTEWLVGALSDGGDEQVMKFRVTVMNEIVASLFALVAFVLIYKKAVSRNARIALRILSVCELYMFSYYTYMFIHPLTRNALVDIIANLLLLVAIIVCCYGYSLFCADNRLEPERRSWAVLIPVTYIMSFTALFAPSWQRYIPLVEGNSSLMPDYSFLYVAFAIFWNIMRSVAVWELLTSSLFVDDGRAHVNEPSSMSPMNRYVLAILVASLFVVKGLAFVYENTFTLLEL